MRPVLWRLCAVAFGCLAILAGAVAADAAAYDDFANGLTALNNDDGEAAIAAFSAALSAGDLSANLVPVAYMERARAHLMVSQCDAARTDVETALKLKADYEDGFVVAALVDDCRGDFAAAASDASHAIALHPLPTYYAMRAWAHWCAGDFADAASDYRRALAQMHGERTYFALDAEVGELRSGTLTADIVSRDVSDLDLDDWPRPVFDLYRGKASPADVADAASKADASALPGRKCEAEYYTAEWQFAQNNGNEAKALLNQAKANCPKDFIEFKAAVLELERLK